MRSQQTPQCSMSAAQPNQSSRHTSGPAYFCRVGFAHQAITHDGGQSPPYWVVLLIASCLSNSTRLASAADILPAAPTHAVLHLANDGFVTGELQENAVGSAIRWQSPAFTAPFDFALNGVSAVHFPAPAKLPRPTGEWCFELDQGTVLFGTLIDWSGDALEIDASRIGRVRVKSSSVRRFFRSRDSGDVIYLGPSGLAGWQLSPASKAWREDFGHLATDQEGFAQGNFGIPPRAAIEFEISWKKKPDFVLALAVGDDEKSLKEAFRFEVWFDELVIQRDLDKLNLADPAEVQSIGAGPRTRPSAGLSRPESRPLPGLFGQRQQIGGDQIGPAAAADLWRGAARKRARRHPPRAVADRALDRRSAARSQSRPTSPASRRRFHRIRADFPVRRRVGRIRAACGVGRNPNSRGPRRQRFSVVPEGSPVAGRSRRIP